MLLVEYARQYIGRSWFIFPCAPRDKTPLTKRGFKDASTDPATIEAWWARTPDANLGLATGLSGMVVLDCDGPEGIAALAELTRQHGPLPRTLCAKTARGIHIFFAGTGVKSSQIKAEKLDVRGSTGYVILPPSIHPSGAVYQWIDALAPIAALPEWTKAWANSRKGGATQRAAARAVPEFVKAGRGLAQRSIEAQTIVSFSTSEANRLRSALTIIDADTDYATWITYGQALHDLKWIVNGNDEGFGIWNEWSSRSKGDAAIAGEGGYPGTEELARKWASFDRDYQGVRTTVASIFKAAMDAGWQHQPEPIYVNSHSSLPTLPESFVNATAAAPIIWLDRDQHGRPKTTCGNVMAAMAYLGIKANYDTFHEKMRLAGQPLGEFAGDLTDNAVHMLRLVLRETLRFDPGRDAAYDGAVQAALANSYDPVQDYLDSLVWDGTPRLRSWLAVYLGAEATPLNQAIGGLTLIAAVRRVRQPGHKFDQIIVIIGPEGRGKSEAIETLAGPENFSDQTILTADDRSQQEAMQGVWLYEIADLAGMHKADVEKVKAFASRRMDRARPAYGRVRVDRPRRTIFFATTNHETFLKGYTGNRRFWPVEAGRIDVAALRRDRDQLWAEAAACEARGVPLVLPEALWGDAAKLQDARRDADPWDDILAHVRGTPTPDKTETRIATRDLFRHHLEMAGDRINDVNTKRLVYTMRRLGWDGPKALLIGEHIMRGYAKKV